MARDTLQDFHLLDHVLCDPHRATELRDDQLAPALVQLLETLASVLNRVLEQRPLEFAGAVPPARRLLSLEQCAQELNVEVSTVGRMVKYYELPAYKIGRHLRVSRMDLEKYKKNHTLAKERGRI